ALQDKDLPAEFVDKAEGLLQKAKEKGILSAEDHADLLKRFREMEELAKKSRQRRTVVARLNELAEKPSPSAIKEARAAVARQARQEPNFPADPQVTGVMNKLYDAHLRSVTYVEQEAQLDKPPRVAEDAEPSLILDQLVNGVPPAAKDN